MNTLEAFRTSSSPCICPGCGHTTDSVFYRLLHNNGESFIYRCQSCTLEFLRPLVLLDVEERKMESVDGAVELFESNLLRTLHKRLIINPEIAKARQLLGKKDFRMLDIGCGTGLISQIWAESGAIVTGLEPSPKRAAIARQRGLDVLSCYAEELKPDQKFDLIVIRHVVEHFEHPQKILRELIPQLTNNGLLLIVVPNIYCIGRKIFGTNWTWVLPWHCSFFNPKALRMLLISCGYNVSKLYQTPSPLWYPQSFTRRFPRIGRALSTTPLSMLFFAPLIALGYLTGRSDNITVFARPQKKS